MPDKFFIEKSVTAIRILLALQYLISGLNWYFKILPFPSLSDGADFAQKHEIAAAMIATGWMFDATKIIELLTGLSLLFNRFVPLMLVVSITVAATAFLLDAFILDEIFAFFAGSISGAIAWAAIKDMVFFGGVVIIMQIYLMLAYLDCYKPMLAMKPTPTMSENERANNSNDSEKIINTHKIKITGMKVIACIAIFLGVVADLWFIGMLNQWLIPWSSLSWLSA